jgi:hypothetical protein
VSGSILSFASSKSTERDAIEPSGFVAPLIHVPVNGMDVASLGSEVGGKAVGAAGVAVGAAQADSTTSRSRVVMFRMYVSIFEPVVFITTLQRGIVEMK